MSHAGESGPARDRRKKDLSARWLNSLVLWGIPVAVIIAGQSVGPRLRTVMWTAALLQMSLACIANAVRCGRIHCYFTGTFFLIAAAATAAHGTGLLPLGPGGWEIIGYAVLVGGVSLWYLPELIWGRYGRQGS